MIFILMQHLAKLSGTEIICKNWNFGIQKSVTNFETFENLDKIPPPPKLFPLWKSVEFI